MTSAGRIVRPPEKFQLLDTPPARMKLLPRLSAERPQKPEISPSDNR